MLDIYWFIMLKNYPSIVLITSGGSRLFLIDGNEYFIRFPPVLFEQLPRKYAPIYLEYIDLDVPIVQDHR